jgi:hypothetical protein
MSAPEPGRAAWRVGLAALAMGASIVGVPTSVAFSEPFGSQGAPETAPIETLPPDVDAFIPRLGGCSELRKHPNHAVRVALKCDRLAADKAALNARYRHQPKILAAINGRWIKVTQRVPVRLEPWLARHDQSRSARP